MISLIYDYVKKHKEVYIYGAGHFGMAVHSFLVGEGLAERVKGYVVTSDLISELNGLSVNSIDDIAVSTGTGIIISVSENNLEGIKHELESRGFFDFFCLLQNDLEELEEKEYSFSEHLLNERIKTKENRKKVGVSKRILVIKLDGIGDAILCTPFIRELKRSQPDSHITMLSSLAAYDIWRYCPYIDELIKFENNGIGKLPKRFIMDYCESFMKKNCTVDYDVAYVPRFDTDYYYAGFLAFLSGASERYSYSESVTDNKRVKNRYYDLLYTDVCKDSEVDNEAKKNLHILEWIGGRIIDDSLEVWGSGDDEKSIDSIIGHFGTKERQILIAIGLSGKILEKRWSVYNYYKVIKELQKWNKRLRFVIIGDKRSEKETEWYNESFEENDIINCSGRLSLPETVSLLKRTRIYIGNDTGLMHISAACGNYVIELNHVPEVVEDSSEYGNVRFVPWKTGFTVLRPLSSEIENAVGSVKTIDCISTSRVIECAQKIITDMDSDWDRNKSCRITD